ncbi:MAG: hypothetical protein WCI94_03815 [Rhodospirillales bacterium]
MPPVIAFVLDILQTLIGYGEYLYATVPQHAAHPHFPKLAASFATQDVGRFRAHIWRGILRATMLRHYLRARAKQGRDIAETPIPSPAEPATIEALEMNLRAGSGHASGLPARSRLSPGNRLHTDPNNPLYFYIPSVAELAAQMRRRTVGRILADICLDLGIDSGNTARDTWQRIEAALMGLGDGYSHYCEVKEQRRLTVRRELKRGMGIWPWDVQDNTQESIQAMLGFLCGAAPPDRCGLPPAMAPPTR